MNENEYYKWVDEMNTQYAKNRKRKRIFNYFKNNHLAIIDLILSAIAIIISIIALNK